MAEATVRHQGHFESLERQEQAAKFGMWVFLASEVLFFGALFTLYAAYRVGAPRAFDDAAGHNTLFLGSTNTLVLLLSSFFIAVAVHRLREGAVKPAAILVFGTMGLAVLFLAIKAVEYWLHFEHGIFPGGIGHYFQEVDDVAAHMAFWNLYYVTTGLHAIHVTIGVVMLAVLGFRIRTGKLAPSMPHGLAIGALYWHIVDVMWLFIWPLYYLMRGGEG